MKIDPSKSKSIDPRYYNDHEIQMRFFEKVEQQPLYNERLREDMESCWVYTGAHNESGYSVFTVRDLDKESSRRISKKTGKKYQYYPYKRFYGHRLSYAIFNDGENLENMTVEHLCGNTSCVNPDHLVLLSIADNSSAKFERYAKDLEYDWEKFRANDIDTSKFIFDKNHIGEELILQF